MREVISFVAFLGILPAFIGFIIQSIRKKPNKKRWGIAALCCLILFIVIPMPNSKRPNNEVSKNTTKVKVEKKVVKETKPSAKKVKRKKPKKEQSEVEKFAKDNNISVTLAKDLKKVLGEMELTDKSRVGTFHYELSDVYEWERIEDWAEGRRYSGWMDMEHIFYYYVKDDRIVSVRTSDGSFLYQVE